MKSLWVKLKNRQELIVHGLEDEMFHLWGKTTYTRLLNFSTDAIVWKDFWGLGYTKETESTGTIYSLLLE